VTDRQKFDANLWGFRFGPYLDLPVSEHFHLSISGGLAGGVLDSHVSWSQTAGTTGPSGSGEDTDVLWGGYGSAALSYQINPHWGLFGGAQYQNLGKYDGKFGGRKVELDLSDSVFITFGLSYTFDQVVGG